MCLEALTASLKEQASQIQKVSDQFQLSKPAQQLAGNDGKPEHAALQIMETDK